MSSFQSDFRRRERRFAAFFTRVSPLRDYALAAIGGFAALLCVHALLLADAPAVARSVSIAFYPAVAILFGALMHATYPHRALGWCNVITMLRLVLVSALIAPLFFDGPHGWLVFGLSAVALALDGVDGWLARREQLVSGFGARFDVEVDSLLALVLSLHAFLGGKAGVLVLVLGLIRYAFVLASLVQPWLRGPLPERFSRKAVCVLQLSVLIVLQLPFVTPPLSDALVLVAAAALLWSFGRDIHWLHRSRP